VAYQKGYEKPLSYQFVYKMVYQSRFFGGFESRWPFFESPVTRVL
jgi:hypothetical protein